MRPIVVPMALAVIAVALACTSGSGNSEDSSPVTAVPEVGASVAQGVCPVTPPNFSRPPGESVDSTYLGNGTIWTIVYPDGVARIDGRTGEIHEDGSLEIKWPWYVKGSVSSLKVTGRRLDGQSPPARISMPPGITIDPPGFQPSSLLFPTEGCWEISAQVGTSTLSFVTKVVRE